MVRSIPIIDNDIVLGANNNFFVLLQFSCSDLAQWNRVLTFATSNEKRNLNLRGTTTLFGVLSLCAYIHIKEYNEQVLFCPN